LYNIFEGLYIAPCNYFIRSRERIEGRLFDVVKNASFDPRFVKIDGTPAEGFGAGENPENLDFEGFGKGGDLEGRSFRHHPENGLVVVEELSEFREGQGWDGHVQIPFAI
jgi:hypothetical protein